MTQPPYVSAFFYLNTVGYFLHKKKIRPWTTAVASTHFSTSFPGAPPILLIIDLRQPKQPS